MTAPEVLYVAHQKLIKLPCVTCVALLHVDDYQHNWKDGFTCFSPHCSLVCMGEFVDFLAWRPPRKPLYHCYSYPAYFFYHVSIHIIDISTNLPITLDSRSPRQTYRPAATHQAAFVRRPGLLATQGSHQLTVRKPGFERCLTTEGVISKICSIS